MNTSLEQVGFDEVTSSDSAVPELDALGQAVLMPNRARRLYLHASLRLTRAQKELHDATFALDGSPESLDRYASARSELDSAEAWALHVVKALPRQHLARSPRAPRAV